MKRKARPNKLTGRLENRDGIFKLKIVGDKIRKGDKFIIA